MAATQCTYIYIATYHVSANCVLMYHGECKARLRFVQVPHGDSVHESVIDVTDDLERPFESVDMDHITVGQPHRTECLTPNQPRQVKVF